MVNTSSNTDTMINTIKVETSTEKPKTIVAIESMNTESLKSIKESDAFLYYSITMYEKKNKDRSSVENGQSYGTADRLSSLQTKQGSSGHISLQEEAALVMNVIPTYWLIIPFWEKIMKM